MKLRNLAKMNTINNGTRSLAESIVIPEVIQALNDWKQSTRSNSVLIGGLAASYYTRPRGTTDADFLFMSENDIPNDVRGFKRIRPGAFLHKATHVEVEVVTPQSINITLDLVRKVFETAIDVDGIKIASPTGIVALKLQRLKRYDQGDIVALIETGKVDLTGWPISPEQLTTFNTSKQNG